jgi:hypothetical protein
MRLQPVEARIIKCVVRALLHSPEQVAERCMEAVALEARRDFPSGGESELHVPAKRVRGGGRTPALSRIKVYTVC